MREREREQIFLSWFRRGKIFFQRLLKRAVNERCHRPEIVGFADVPVLERDWPAIGHPKESPLFRLIRTRRPEMFVSESEIFDVFFQSIVFLLGGYASQVHTVITTVLRRSVPVGLRNTRANESSRDVNQQRAPSTTQENYPISNFSY